MSSSSLSSSSSSSMNVATAKENRTRKNEEADCRCPICLNFLDKPVALGKTISGILFSTVSRSCSHSFCEKCINQLKSNLSLQNIPRCPICRESFSKQWPDPLKAAAVNSYVRKHFGLGVEECNKIEAEPNRPSLSNIQYLVNSNNFEMAERLAGNIISSDEKQEAYRIIGRGYVKKQNVNALFKIAEQIPPKNRFEIFSKMANIFINEGQFLSAETVADKIPSTCSYRDEIFTTLTEKILSNLLNNKPSAASSSGTYSQTSLSSSSTSSSSTQSFGTSAHSISSYADTSSLFRTAEKISPQRSEILFKVAHILIIDEKFDAAEKIADKILDATLKDKIYVDLVKKNLKNFNLLFELSSSNTITQSSGSSSVFATKLLYEANLYEAWKIIGKIFDSQLKDKFLLKIAFGYNECFIRELSYENKKHFLKYFETIFYQIQDEQKKHALYATLFNNLFFSNEYERAQKLLKAIPESNYQILLDEALLNGRFLLASSEAHSRQDEGCFERFTKTAAKIKQLAIAKIRSYSEVIVIGSMTACCYISPPLGICTGISYLFGKIVARATS